MRKVALGGFVCALLLSFTTPAAAARPSVEDTLPAPGLYCVERVAMPDLVNVIDAKWSPDAQMLAVVRFERRPSGGPAGYIEDEVLDFLEVMERQTGEVIAKLTPTNPEFRWQGDTLLYLEKSTIRAWKGGRTAETLGRLGDTKVPRYPED
ncbi:MAG: hypothetical protein E6J49_16095, partial [Chloroflexi bacterium]